MTVVTSGFTGIAFSRPPHPWRGRVSTLRA